MSSSNIRGKYKKVPEYSKAISIKKELNTSKAVIPFSTFFKNNNGKDVYSGFEKIPFKERDPDYKMILKEEFANNLKVEFKIFKSVIKFPSF